MTAARLATTWRVPKEHTQGGAWTAKKRSTTVRGHGACRVSAHDTLVDEVAVMRGCAEPGNPTRVAFSSLTVAERREVVARLLARRMTVSDIARRVCCPPLVIDAYRAWIETGRWPNDLG